MSDTPTTALVEEAPSMTTDTLIEEAMGEMRRLGIDNLRAKGAIVLLVEALRRAEAERDESRRDAEAYKRQTQEVSAKAIELTKEVSAKLDQAEAELDAATTQLAKKFKRLEELERRCTHAGSERDELRATVTRLNRRAQTAEAGVRDNVEACKAAGVSMGRTLANAAADMYLRRAEQAEAERDAQHAEVLRLTGERDALAKDLARIEAVAAIAGSVARWDSLLNEMHKQKAKVSELLKTIEELRAQVWGLICAGSNMAARRRHFQGLWEALLADGLKRDAQLSELTVTRDLLTAENARLQKEVATLERLRRGGK